MFGLPYKKTSYPANPMHVHLLCPHCQQSQQAEIQLPGQAVPCQNCGKPLTAMLNQTEAVVSSPPSVVKEPASSNASQEKRPNTEVEQQSIPSTPKPPGHPSQVQDEPRQEESHRTPSSDSNSKKGELWSDVFWGVLLTIGGLAIVTFQPLLPVFSPGLKRFVIDQLANVALGLILLGVGWILYLAYHRKELFRFIIPFYYFSFVVKYKEVTRKPAACISVGLLIIVFAALLRLMPLLRG
jgi:cation transport ATPase